ncbi:hypothetical protein EC968_007011 [Mortierella alpina]|nr:hypothetical protein EC968_007011 [Mortierella alpina]
MWRSIAESTRITATILLWTLLFLTIVEATVVSPSQRNAVSPTRVLLEKRKHQDRQKSAIHRGQHADDSDTTTKSHYRHHHRHAVVKKQEPNSHKKSTFFRNSKIFIAGRPDWYNHYRQQHGPHSIIRKLTLESSHRRKATLTFPLGGTPSGGLESAADEDGNDELGTESKATAEDQAGGAMDKPVGSEDQSGEGKVEDVSEAGHEDDEGGRGSESIQAVKKPQFVGVPTPVSVRHSGIIPKESSCGRLEKQGRLQAWMVVAMAVGVVLNFA